MPLELLTTDAGIAQFGVHQLRYAGRPWNESILACVRA